MQTVELKCELRDPDLAEPMLWRIGAVRVAGFDLRDTYFRVPDARLKKRECAGEPTEWIYYQRDEAPGPRTCRFKIYSEQEAAARFGARPMPVWLVIEQRRELWARDAVRIHIDRVADLGWFIEFESLVSKRRPIERCKRSILQTRDALMPIVGETICCGYADLLGRAAV